MANDDARFSAIRSRFSNLDTYMYRDRGKRAPHKPLLILYAIARTEDGDRRLSYERVYEDVSALLDTFGPSHPTHPKYPFWWLQKDGVWEVEGADDLPRRSGNKEPLVRAMKEHDTHAGFTEDVWRAFRENGTFRREIAQMMLDDFFPPSLHDDIIEAVGLDLGSERLTCTRRPRDPAFRKEVLAAYNHRCAVCGYDLRVGDRAPIGLEAAHIRWHQYDGPDEVTNGLALCALHHKLFDRGAIHVTEAMRLLVADTVRGSNPHLRRLRAKHGEPIHRPDDAKYTPKGKHVTWHVREVYHGRPTADR